MANLEPKHQQELSDSVIDPQIIDLNFKSLSGEPGEDGLSEAADYLMPSDDLTRSEHGKSPYTSVGSGWSCGYGHDLENGGLFKGQGCFKADKPIDRKKKDEATGEWVVDEKKAKYLNQPGRPAQYFALRLSFAGGLEIAQRYGLAEAYGEHRGTNHPDDEDKDFWAWTINQKTIPLLITEGAKKSGCLLSAGYSAIGLPGIWMGCESGANTLKPGIALAAAGREVIIVFDMDDKPKTQKTVNSAAAKLANACKAAGAIRVTGVEWSHVDGKGVDDLIVKEGADAFAKVLAQRKEVKEIPRSRSTTEDNPCPVCGESDGECFVPENGKSVTCAHKADGEEVDGWKYKKQSSDSRSVFHPIKPAEAEKAKKKNAADVLIELATASATYFHTADKAAYADIQIDGNRHTYAVRSRAFKLWLSGEYFSKSKSGINSQYMNDTLSTLEAIAIFQGETHEVYLRTAEHQGKIYLDLGTSDWKAVEIDAVGWRVVLSPPVRFWRPESLLPLPYPVEDGSLDDLKELLNVSGASWTLIITFLLFCFCPDKTYPVLVISAHRGSGKTAAAEILKGLIDPGKAPLIKLQGDTQKLAIAATRRWMMVYDNVSYISSDQSDDLCRVATGFGFSTRTLHTTDEETTFEFTRPQIITAIDALVTRDDLADRVLMVQLPEITEDQRLPQAALTEKVEAARPGILGALLTALSQTLAQLPHTNPDKLPRMADYALFAIAAEKAVGLKTGEFRETFDQARNESRQVVIEASPIGEAIMKLMESKLVWKGTSSQLLLDLTGVTDEGTYKSKYWPKAANVFKRQLTRLTPDLKALGIEVREGTRSNNKEARSIVLEKVIKTSSTSSTSSTNAPKPLQGKHPLVDDNEKSNQPPIVHQLQVSSTKDQVSSTSSTNQPLVEPLSRESSGSLVDDVDDVDDKNSLSPQKGKEKEKINSDEVLEEI
jgi:Domain of unknown function (DUF3854)